MKAPGSRLARRVHLRTLMSIRSRIFAKLAALALVSLLASSANAEPAGGSLDLATLQVRLHDTSAIGILGKLRLKHEVEALMGDLASFHAGRETGGLDALHDRYRKLVSTVVAQLQQGDDTLAHDLAASAERLWADLADPGRFAALAGSAAS